MVLRCLAQILFPEVQVSSRRSRRSLTQRVQIECNCGTRSQKQYCRWVLSPNSTKGTQLDPLGEKSLEDAIANVLSPEHHRWRFTAVVTISSLCSKLITPLCEGLGRSVDLIVERRPPWPRLLWGIGIGLTWCCRLYSHATLCKRENVAVALPSSAWARPLKIQRAQSRHYFHMP